MRHSHSSATTAATAVMPARLTLTRRGRLLLIGMPILLTAVLGLIALGLVAGAAANQVQASEGAPVGVEAEVVDVSHGDTLWSVASRVDSEEDVQTLITQIAELNDLDSSELQPGQQLYIPVQP
ncbi:LysM peptidoglycan-binding domain-containing protein [Nesterenkonia aerolata]|uniref:LysM peptidoglycan-binding domain-containing protein n=1 Tax=Nesterenkonia aerolata TaxID=3074079 RepID=A0ABU2DN79_9MICC|nr:LysM peptidoglycan-binding domain-containing protein [Nesterenkonia sp. LY-0111]MDR8017964.1 LysM peptidoglycan-binding domain-containing protein [Nesterenkonia sp. LY-0111]